MRQPFVTLAVAVLAAALLSWGCAPAAPAPAPTKAPAAPAPAPTKAPAAPTAATAPTKAPAAAPTAAPAPTKAAAAAPTTAPAPKVAFPEKGKTLTMIVPTEAGGNADTAARLVAAPLEKALGITIQVVNRPGASQQVGMTELSLAKPDGYTIGGTGMGSTILVYSDPDRKAAFNRASFAPVATTTWSHQGVAVKASSPYKTVKDLVDAAKAKPGQISMGTNGVLTQGHLDAMSFEKVAGIRFNFVHFTGGAPATTALLGGHVDSVISATTNYTAQFKSGDVRLLGIMSKQQTSFYPGLKTFEEQGYKLSSGSVNAWSAPKGTPKEIVDVLSRGIKQAMDTPELQQKLKDGYWEPYYLNADDFAAFWAELEATLKPLLEEAKKLQK